MSRYPTFETASVDPAAPRSGRPALTAAVSIAAHALALAAVVVIPLLADDRLPEAVGEVQAFFATPLELAPPPPPPPPPAPGRVAPRVEASRPQPAAGFQAPVEVPTEIVPEAGLDLGFEGGEPGGVAGGVPGGVVGGIVAGLPEPPPPPRLEPVRVGGVVKEPRKIKDVPPVYPALAAQGRIEGVVVLECLLDTRGRVQQVKVLRGVPLLEEAAVEAVRQWAYTPTLVGGEPVEVIMTVTVSFRLRD
jgi:protein TonB